MEKNCDDRVCALEKEHREEIGKLLTVVKARDLEIALLLKNNGDDS